MTIPIDTTTMNIHHIHLHHIALPYVHPFETSFGRELTREAILVAVEADGLTGWGECVAGGRAVVLLRDHRARPGTCCATSSRRPCWARRSASRSRWCSASAACAATPWPAPAWRTPSGTCSARPRAARWQQMLGGVRARVPVGVSVGIEPTLDALLAPGRGLRRGRLWPRQAQDQARLGRRGGAGRARALARPAAASRRQLGLHPGRRRRGWPSWTPSTCC